MFDKIKKYIKIFVPLGLGLVISLITKDNMNIYDEIIKPPLAPPKIVFPIVWTILYLFIGYAYYKDSPSKVKKLYYTNLFLNALWSIVFFNLRWFLISIIIILLLLINTFILISKFKYSSKISYYLFIPYFIWLLIATYLNIFIYILN